MVHRIALLRRRPLVLPALVCVLALVAGILEPVMADVLGGAPGSVAAPPAAASPVQGTPASLDGLNYPDPGAGLDVLDPPSTDSFGAAQMTYPIDVPQGRNQWQPQLAVNYASDGEDGWLGMGWSLALDGITVPGFGQQVSADAIQVDTRWGVPRYLEGTESENYIFGDQILAPNAHRADQLPRQAERRFTKRVEGDFLRIVRHGNSPKNYWWEVDDKLGNKYFYGGAPDDLPVGSDFIPSGHQDSSAILTDEVGNVYWWGLKEKWDISSDVVTYFYNKEVGDTGVQQDGHNEQGALPGTELYLSRINYTGSRLRSVANYPGGGLPRYGPYDVRFITDRDLGEDRRPDVSIDARGGGLHIMARLLRRIDVTYTPLGSTTPQLVRRYELTYRVGPYNKNLLTSIGKTGSDGRVFSRNTFDYYNDVQDASGNYQGFGPLEHWSPGNDHLGTELLGVKSASVLGGAKSTGGDGRLFLGFNPLIGDKGLSLGGGVQFGGSDGETNVEFLDINGDALPDKVFEDGGTIYYRLNNGDSPSDPSAAHTFGPRQAIEGLDHLSQDSTFFVGGGPEAYFEVLSLMYTHTWTSSKQTSYFTDVNGDGLPDLVDGGTVLFDHVRDDGSVFFSRNSGDTRNPIDHPGVLNPSEVPDLSGITAAQRGEFPLQDTVRRWVAPFAGGITIDAPVKLHDPSASVDGVRVSIQHNADTLWSQRIDHGDTTTYVPPFTGANVVHVERGDRIYFRLQSLENGAGDVVDWSPRIDYVGAPGPGERLDQNLKDEFHYSSADDFTLAGLPGVFVNMPFTGRVHLGGVLHKTKVTSDDLRIRVQKNDTTEFVQPVAGSFVGDIPIDVDVDVIGRHKDSNGNVQAGDKLLARLEVDSNIDPSAVSWKPDLYYIQAQDQDGNALPVKDADGNYMMRLKAPVGMDLYPNTNSQLPQETGGSDSGFVDFLVNRDNIPSEALPATIVFTAKTTDGVLRFKKTLTIPAGSNVYHCGDDVACDRTFNFDSEGKGIFYDFTFPDPRVGPAVITSVNSGAQPSANWWPGTSISEDETSAFPPPYRGWGYAGYNGSGDRADQPLHEGDFVLHKSDFPDQNPTSHDDPNYKNPVHGNAYPYAPFPDLDQWLGPKTASPGVATGATWGAATEMSSSLLGPDQLGPPPPGSIVEPNSEAPAISSELNTDSLGAGFLILGTGVAWGKSVGETDYLDLNGDAYPDVVGSNVIFTNQVGGLDQSVDEPHVSEVRYAHEFTTQFSGTGSPASVSSQSNGKANADHPAGHGSSPMSHGHAGSSNQPSIGGGGNAAGDATGADAWHAASPSGGKSGISAGGHRTQTAGAGAAREGASPGGKGGGTGAGEGGGALSGVAKATRSKRAGAVAKSVGKAALAVGEHLGLSLSGGLEQQESNSQDGGKQADDDSNTQVDFADLNGDELPDRVEVGRDGNLYVRWNLGYRFSDQVAVWPRGQTLEEGQSDTQSFEGGLGFNAGQFDFAGGVSLDKATDVSTVTWADVNGDGLDDRLTAHADPVTGDSSGVDVELNTGSGLASPIHFGDFIDNQVAQTVSTSLGGGADFTIGIGPLCFRFCYIIINPGFHVLTSYSTPTIDLVDVNGDGLLDSVKSTDDGELQVKENQSGRTNLLKSVHGPLGSTYTIDYKLTGNTTRHAEANWLISDVKVNDGHPGDGADVQETRYTFLNQQVGYNEREDYGASEVIEQQIDPATGRVYRTWDRTYENDNYYERGLLLTETLLDADGHKITQTINTYTPLDAATGTPAPALLTSTVSSVFPALTRTQERWFDSSGRVAKSTETDFGYDARGNLIKVLDLGEPAVRTDDVEADMTYTQCDANPEFPNTQVANSLVVRSGSRILQRRDADAPCDFAAVTEVRDYLDAQANGPVAVTDVTYADVGGQVTDIVGPAGADGKRMHISYGYDDPDHQGAFVTSTTDENHNLTTRATYDPLRGDLVRTVDPNGATTTYTYDDQGRLTSVTGPLEQGSGHSTISYEYHPDSAVPWAMARHVDAANPGHTIDTVDFVDGLGRDIQTKHTATLFAGATPTDRMVVSGRTVYDAFARPVQQYRPTDESLGSPGVFNTSLDSVAPTVTNYDVLDRVTSVVQPGGRTTTEQYGFGAGPFSTKMFTRLETDPSGMRTRSYTNVRSDLVAVERLHRLPNNTDQSLMTRYEYDPMDRLVRVVDQTGAASTASYDLLGRRTSVTTPDGGRVDFGYDLAGNLTSRVTPVLRAEGAQVTYSYDAGRLTHISYPDNPQNDVTYEYGDTGAPGNAAGLVTKEDDGSRTQTRSYDLLGNVTRETTLVKVHDLSKANAPQHTYTTRFVYDTWGRLLSMAYPDGEALSYAYDTGGLPKSVQGTKDGRTYHYVDRLEYDKYGDRAYLSYGNGVTTQRTYDANTGWLASQLTKSGSTIIQDLHYTYDKAGDVVERNDTRPIPPSGIHGGPSDQTFSYNDLHQITAASGAYRTAHDVRTYDAAFTYDATGRRLTKDQTDLLDGRKQPGTTYSLTYAYQAAQPHAPSHVGRVTNTWDANGDLVKWKDDKSTAKRTVTWDEEDRPTVIDDASGSPEYFTYDDENALVIRRQGKTEVEYPNDYYTSFGGAYVWKNIFIDGVRVATKRVSFSPSVPETIELFSTTDLTGSTNLVTDPAGNVTEHFLFFPGGEPWVAELDRADVGSNVQHERYLFAGAYVDQAHDLYLVGTRWYDPQTEVMYSADPTLTDDLDATVAEPQLLDAYGYGYDNPESLIDVTGLEAASAQDTLRTKVWSRVRKSLQNGFVQKHLIGTKKKKDTWEVKLHEALDTSTLIKIKIKTKGGFKISEEHYDLIKKAVRFFRRKSG